MTLTLDLPSRIETGSSIALHGLRKSYRTPGGVVEALRGIDVADGGSGILGGGWPAGLRMIGEDGHVTAREAA